MFYHNVLIFIVVNSIEAIKIPSAIVEKNDVVAVVGVLGGWLPQG